MQLAAQSLRALRDRNGLDTSVVDDVVLGCVTPVGEQGADIARVAALVAGLRRDGPGRAAEPLLRLGARGGEQRRGAGHVRPVRRRDRRRRRVDVARRRWAATAAPGTADPAGCAATLFRAAGHQRRPDRDARWIQPRRTSTATRSRASDAPRHAHGRTAGSRRSVVPVTDRRSARSCSSATSTCAPSTTRRRASPKPQARLRAGLGERGRASTRWRSSQATRRSRPSTTCTPPATRAASSTAPRRC